MPVLFLGRSRRLTVERLELVKASISSLHIALVYVSMTEYLQRHRVLVLRAVHTDICYFVFLRALTLCDCF